MKKLATVTNLIYVLAFGVHAYHMSIVAIPLLILGVTSAMYHYLYARDHAGLVVDKQRLKLYQNFDVASIYLVLGVYPYQLAGGWWWLFFIPCLIMLLQKLFSRNSWDSHVLIPVVAIVVFVLAYLNRPTYLVISAIIAMTAAVVASKFADYYLSTGHPEKYDRLHADWHNYSGVAFMAIV